MIRFGLTLQENSINRLVITSFIFVLLLPIGFFIYSLFQNSWHQVEQRMLEKHQLISTSLVEPLFLYINKKQESIRVISKEIQAAQAQHSPFLSHTLNKEKRVRNIQALLDKHLYTFSDFIALSYTDNLDSSASCVSTIQDTPNRDWAIDYKNADFRPIQNSQAQQSLSDSLSSAFISSVTDKPIVVLRHKIFDQLGNLTGTIHAEISLSNIATMCSKINFGVKGHCATVDNKGQLIAHPNKDWEQSLRSVSKLSIVQKMLAGETGTTEFYSPFLKEDMVAGFSAIPRLGWGVMIPQPKSEITSVFAEIRSSILLWLLFGIISAALIAWKLADEITTPIRLLMQRTNQMAKSQYLVDLGQLPKNSPKEIKQLWSEFSHLLSGLQKSHTEVERLNKSLNKDIESATEELRKKNRKLYELSNLDYLTTLPNRRFFTHFLTQKISSTLDQEIGVIFIDVDHFKSINDKLGHEIGDAALVHLANILKDSIRKEDIAARLGGDEFVVYIENASEFVISNTAEKIRQVAQSTPLYIQDQTIHLSLSLGTVRQIPHEHLSAKDFFRFADKAMYQSKEKGRNTVTHFSDQSVDIHLKSAI